MSKILTMLRVMLWNFYVNIILLSKLQAIFSF